ncbi:kinase-like domain-containing protein, partial [Pelagophyceae sp. CCMP2097]
FVRVARLDATVVALSSKTRPKKLAFVCDDGKRRAFLLKGAEDVHMDERVMQMLAVVNRMAAARRGAQRAAAVATYAVLPLGRTAGLIEWVAATRPLYDIWRRRRASDAFTQSIAERQRKQRLGGAAGGAAGLRRRGVDVSLPRGRWGLRGAFDALTADAPASIIADEVSRLAADAADWIVRRRAYAESLGASCVAAYALGLGDRHLENVLFEARRCVLVDVDWGVCFDGGARLRVPELVPFRLTQCVANALGPARTDAAEFRESARWTLEALRRRAADAPGGGGAAAPGPPRPSPLLALLELCCRDARVQWRATLGHPK